MAGSYGFTLQGGCPCRVGRADSGGPADEIGLMSGDVISKVNGENVMTARTDCLARIIRYGKQHLIVSLKN